MTAAAPWSVKGIDPKAREIAKDLARRSGMTLGEWLNSMIMDEPEEDDSVATLPRRSPIPDPYDRRSRSRRLDDVYGEDAHRHEGLGRMGASLEVIAERLEAAERRSTLAIQGIDQAVVGLVRRMEAQDEAEAAKARRIDDIAEELREGHRRLRRLEQDAGAEARDGLDKLDAALTAVSTRLYEMDERQRAGVSELRDRIEAVEKAAGPGAAPLCCRKWAYVWTTPSRRPQKRSRDWSGRSRPSTCGCATPSAASSRSTRAKPRALKSWRRLSPGRWNPAASR
ncbi:hypothetical protein V8F63_03435 [Brevundimonas sp. LF-1]|uniref:hypothetical protein n=1 Tax=Brevundimonas sp. LF-1 TaxID=3126100 RepID=UPI0030DF31BA